MFLDDLCYISNTNTGAPVGSGENQKTLLELLEKIFNGPVISYDAINGQEVTRNAGVNFNKTTILEISDGVKSIFSRVNVLNNNTFSFVEDISSLNKNNIIISYPKMNYTVDTTTHTLENIFSKVVFNGATDQQNVSTTLTNKISNISVTSNTAFLFNDSRYEIIYNDIFLFIKFFQNGSFTPMFFLLDEEIILVRKMARALTSIYDMPWQCIAPGIATGITLAEPTIGGQRFAITNLLIFGEKAKYICNPSGVLPGAINKGIYSDVINNKNLFLFYSNDVNYDNGYYLLWGGAL